MRCAITTSPANSWVYTKSITPGDDSRVYFNAFWNEYTDDELRWKDEYGLDRTAEPTGGVTTSRIRHDADRVREEVRAISAFSVGGETVLNGWFTDASLSISSAEEATAVTPTSPSMTKITGSITETQKAIC